MMIFNEQNKCKNKDYGGQKNKTRARRNALARLDQFKSIFATEKDTAIV